MDDHAAVAAPGDGGDVLGGMLTGLQADLDAASARLRAACHVARSVLLDGLPGRLPFRWECREQERWVFDDIERAEHELDRLRGIARRLTPAAAARQATAGARRTVLDDSARREREAARMLGMLAG